MTSRPANTTLKVVFGTSSDSFGKLELPLTVEPYDSKNFGLSGIALSKEFYRASDMGNSLDVELISDRKPLIAQGMQIIPAAPPNSRARKTPFSIWKFTSPCLPFRIGRIRWKWEWR